MLRFSIILFWCSLIAVIQCCNINRNGWELTEYIEFKDQTEESSKFQESSESFESSGSLSESSLDQSSSSSSDIPAVRILPRNTTAHFRWYLKVFNTENLKQKYWSRSLHTASLLLHTRVFDISDPLSDNYGAYLSKTQVKSSINTNVNAVISWLKKTPCKDISTISDVCLDAACPLVWIAKYFGNATESETKKTNLQRNQLQFGVFSHQERNVPLFRAITTLDPSERQSALLNCIQDENIRNSLISVEGIFELRDVTKSKRVNPLPFPLPLELKYDVPYIRGFFKDEYFAEIFFSIKMENKSKILSSTIEVINQRGGNNQTVSVKTEGEDLYSAQFMVNVNEPSFIILYINYVNGKITSSIYPKIFASSETINPLYISKIYNIPQGTKAPAASIGILAFNETFNSDDMEKYRKRFHRIYTPIVEIGGKMDIGINAQTETQIISGLAQSATVILFHHQNKVNYINDDILSFLFTLNSLKRAPEVVVMNYFFESESVEAKMDDALYKEKSELQFIISALRGISLLTPSGYHSDDESKLTDEGKYVYKIIQERQNNSNKRKAHNKEGNIGTIDENEIAQTNNFNDHIREIQTKKDQPLDTKYTLKQKGFRKDQNLVSKKKGVSSEGKKEDTEKVLPIIWPSESDFITSIGSSFFTQYSNKGCYSALLHKLKNAIKRYVKENTEIDMALTEREINEIIIKEYGSQFDLQNLDVLFPEIDCSVLGPGEASVAQSLGSSWTTIGGFSSATRPTYQDYALSEYLSKRVSFPSSSMFYKFGRAFPDLSFVGDSLSFISNGNELQAHGVALATGGSIFTLINERLAEKGRPQLGFANPLLYYLSKIQSKTKSVRDSEKELFYDKNAPFFDVKMGNTCYKDFLNDENGGNATDTSKGFRATFGFDAVSGIGSINYQEFSKTLLEFWEQKKKH